MVTVEGVVVEFTISPGAWSDIVGMAHLPLCRPTGAQVACDAAYTFYEWEEGLAESAHIRLLVRRKTNSKHRDTPTIHDYKHWLRHRIETVIGEITKLFSMNIHATTLSGFILKISLFLFIKLIKGSFSNWQLGYILLRSERKIQ